MEYLSTGLLPARHTEAQAAWYISANMGVWPCPKPLWEMPPEFGAEFLRLCRSLQPWRNVLLERIAGSANS